MYTRSMKITETKLNDNGRDLADNITSLSWRYYYCLFLETSRPRSRHTKMLWKLDGVALEDIMSVPKAQPVCSYVLSVCTLTAWQRSTKLCFKTKTVLTYSYSSRVSGKILRNTVLIKNFCRGKKKLNFASGFIRYSIHDGCSCKYIFTTVKSQQNTLWIKTSTSLITICCWLTFKANIYLSKNYHFNCLFDFCLELELFW